MNKFKIGDKVTITGDLESTESDLGLSNIMVEWKTYNRVCEITDIHRGNFRLYCGFQQYWFNEVDISMYGYPINDINKLLYPDYVEKDGLLVPKENL